MSAFVVPDEHVNALADAVVRLDVRLGDVPKNRTDVGRLLMAQNVKSVNYRYEEETAEGSGYKYLSPKRRYSPVELLKAIDCYEYQSCEDPGWETSEAYAICQNLRKALCSRLNGYDVARAWPITDVDPRAALQEGK